MKNYENEDIVLHNPFTLEEIRLKPGTEDHKKFLSIEFNRRLLENGDITEAKYSDEFKSIAEMIRKNFSSDVLNIGPVMYSPDGDKLMLLVFSKTDFRTKYLLTVTTPQANKDVDLGEEENINHSTLFDRFYDNES